MTTSVRHCHLPSLPCELRNMILALLEPKEVARLMKACKAFEQVARAMVWSECTIKAYKVLAKTTAKRRKDHALKIITIKLEPGRRKSPTGRIALSYLQNLEVKVQPRKNFKINSFLSSTLNTLVVQDLGYRNFLSSLHKATSLEVLRIRYKKCWQWLEPFPRLLTFFLLHTLELDLQVPGQIFLDAANHPNIQAPKLRCLLRRSDVEAVVKIPKPFVRLTSLDGWIDLCVVASLLSRPCRLSTLHLRVKLYNGVPSDIARIFEELGTMTDLQDLSICLATFSDTQPVSISHVELAHLRGLNKLTHLKITPEVAKEGGRAEPYDLDLEDIDEALFMSVLAGKKLE